MGDDITANIKKKNKLQQTKKKKKAEAIIGQMKRAELQEKEVCELREEGNKCTGKEGETEKQNYSNSLSLSLYVCVQTDKLRDACELCLAGCGLDVC